MKRAPPRSQVLAYAEGGIPYVVPRGSLGDRFAAYRDALGPTSRYDTFARATFVPIEDVPTVLAALRASFAVTVQDTLERLQADYLKARVHHAVTAADLAKAATLYPYQREGVSWLADHRQALLADEMGLGKTAQLLMAIPQGSPTLVICPAIAMGTWVAELKRWRADLAPLPLTKRDFFLPKPPHVGLISYDSFPFDVRPLPGMTIICDEAHYLKSAKARRTTNVRLFLARALQLLGRAWLATGTPLLNRPQELWNVLHAAGLAYRAFGTWDNFVELFGGMPAGKIGRWENDAGKKHFVEDPEGKQGSHGYAWTLASPRVRGLLAPIMLRRTRAGVLPDLPTKTWGALPCVLDRAGARECDALLSLLREGESLDAFYSRLGGQVTFEKVSTLLETLSRAKIPSMLEHIASFEEQDEPLVVFSAHRAPVEALKKRPGWVTILGDDSHEERTRKVDAFQNALTRPGGAQKIHGVAGTIQAMGQSVTLTRASRVLFVSRRWTPAENAQAEDRVCRIGQDRGVLVYDLTSEHPLDARLVEVLREKTRLVQSVL